MSIVRGGIDEPVAILAALIRRTARQQTDETGR